jgi:hypothetical protein
MAEQVDAGDLKSPDFGRAGSIPASGIRLGLFYLFSIYARVLSFGLFNPSLSILAWSLRQVRFLKVY